LRRAQQRTEQQPAPEPRHDDAAVLADEAEARERRRGALEDGLRVDADERLHARQVARELGLQSREPLVHHRVIVGAARIAGDRTRLAAIRDRRDEQRPRTRQHAARIAAELAGARHEVHLAVAALGEPAIERLGGRGEARMIEPDDTEPQQTERLRVHGQLGERPGIETWHVHHSSALGQSGASAHASHLGRRA
jgi:hypothetical protein